MHVCGYLVLVHIIYRDPMPLRSEGGGCEGGREGGRGRERENNMLTSEGVVERQSLKHRSRAS